MLHDWAVACQDFEFLIAESMGIIGYRVESTVDFIPTLKTALEQSVPVVIDCPVDYRENLRFSQQAGDLSCIV